MTPHGPQDACPTGLCHSCDAPCWCSGTGHPLVAWHIPHLGHRTGPGGRCSIGNLDGRFCPLFLECHDCRAGCASTAGQPLHVATELMPKRQEKPRPLTTNRQQPRPSTAAASSLSSTSPGGAQPQWFAPYRSDRASRSIGFQPGWRNNEYHATGRHQ